MSQHLIGGLLTKLWMITIVITVNCGDAGSLAEETKLEKLRPLTPEESLKAFRIHPAFQIELAAAEPLVCDPVAMEFDESGAAYVIELMPYNQYAKPGEGPKGRISRLKDVDGDGKFDGSVVFCDELNYPTGLFCYDGGLFVGDAPDLLYLKDEDGDGRADRRDVLFTGFGTDPSGEGQLNSFRWGLDNRIHISTGLDGGEVCAAGTPSAPTRSVRSRRFILDPRTRAFELSSGGGQHGMSFDDWGRIFVCDNSDPAKWLNYDDRYVERNPRLQAPAPAVSIAPDGKYTRVNRISPNDPWRVIRTQRRTAGKFNGPDEGGQPSGFFTAGTGVTIYRGDAWPEEFRGSLLVGEPANNLVYRAVLEENGNSLTAQRADGENEFLASTDTWFRPVQFAHGPDGAIYVLDMYRELIEGAAFLPPDVLAQMDPTAGNSFGRIYRIVPTGFQQSTAPNLSGATTAELVSTLEHPNAWRRETAARLLFQKNDDSAEGPLRELHRRSVSPVGRLQALYALSSLGALEEPDLLTALNDSEPMNRVHAVRLSEQALTPKVVERLLEMAGDHATVRQQLAFTAGALPPTSRDELLIRLLQGGDFSPDVQLGTLSSLGEGGGVFLAGAIRQAKADGASQLTVFISALARQIGSANDPTELSVVFQAINDVDDSVSAQSNLADGAIAGLVESGADLAAAMERTPVPAAANRLQAFLARARETALNVDAPESERLDAIRICGADGRTLLHQETLEELLQPQQPAAIQKGVLAQLAGIDSAETPQLVLAHWRTFTPDVRESALEALMTRGDWTFSLLAAIAEGVIPQRDLSAARAALLTNHRDETIRQRAAEVLGSLPQNSRAAIFEGYRQSLELAGDAERGRSVFRTSCAACHRLEEIGEAVGADLQAIADRGAEGVLLSILDPNREIKPQYQSYNVLTTEGRTYNGMIVAESANALSLRLLDGQNVSIPRSDIEILENSGLSFMPEGFEQSIDRQAMADLLAFLTMPR